MERDEIYDYILKIQSIAKMGLVYSKDPYAITNYNQINDLSRELLEHFMEVKLDRPNFFEKNVYPTPNVSVRVLIFNEDKTKILLVREADTKTYSMPGGWADLYATPSKCAIAECKQEAGIDVELIRLIGICDRTPFKNPVAVPDYVILFEAKQTSEFKEHEYETDDVGYFDIDNLPPISRKTCAEEFKRFIEAGKSNKTIFD